MADARVSSSFIDRPAVGFHVGDEAALPPMLSERSRSRSFVTASIDSMVASARQSAAAAQKNTGRHSPQVNKADQLQFQRFIQKNRPDPAVVPAVAQSQRHRSTPLDEVLTQLERTLAVEDEAARRRVRVFQEQETRAYEHLHTTIATAIEAVSSQLDNSEEALPSALDRLRALTEPKRVLQLLQRGRESSSPNMARSTLLAPDAAASSTSPIFSVLSAGPSSLLSRTYTNDDAVSVTSSLNVEASVTRSERGDGSVLGETTEVDDDVSVVDDMSVVGDVAESNVSSEAELTEDDNDDNDDDEEELAVSEGPLDAEMDLSRSVPMHILQPPSQARVAASPTAAPGPQADAMDLARSIRELSMSYRNGLSDNFSPPDE